jgi:hypothetical protein
MPAWIGALFIGFIVVGLSRERPSRQTQVLILLIILVVIGYQTARTHAF